MKFAEGIEQFILKEVAVGRDVTAIDPNDDLLVGGVIDSHGLMALVTFVEGRYGIVVNNSEITPENFGTVASISAFVARKNGRA